MHWDSEILINFSPLKKGHSSCQVTFSLQKGWPYKRGTNVSQNKILSPIDIVRFIFFCKILFLLWKKSLNSDGQQFNQNQQNKQLPLAWNHRTQKRSRYSLMESEVLAWDRQVKVYPTYSFECEKKHYYCTDKLFIQHVHLNVKRNTSI